MSVCSPCLEIEPVPYCVSNITIGSIALTDTPVYVYVQNIGADQTTQISTTTDGSGVVTITDFQGFEQLNQSFELWVTDQTNTINQRQTITVEGQTGDCLSFRFKDFVDGNNQAVSFSSFAFTLLT